MCQLTYMGHTSLALLCYMLGEPIWYKSNVKVFGTQLLVLRIIHDSMVELGQTTQVAGAEQPAVPVNNQEYL